MNGGSPNCGIVGRVPGATDGVLVLVAVLPVAAEDELAENAHFEMVRYKN